MQCSGQCSPKKSALQAAAAAPAGSDTSADSDGLLITDSDPAAEGSAAEHDPQGAVAAALWCLAAAPQLQSVRVSNGGSLTDHAPLPLEARTLAALQHGSAASSLRRLEVQVGKTGQACRS